MRGQGARPVRGARAGVRDERQAPFDEFGEIDWVVHRVDWEIRKSTKKNNCQDLVRFSACFFGPGRKCRYRDMKDGIEWKDGIELK